MLTLKLTPREYAALLRYLYEMVSISQNVPFQYQNLTGLVLTAYLGSFRERQVEAWRKRRHDKEYKLNVPLHAAKALHDEMQHSMLIGWQQMVLNKLDQAVVGYSEPVRENNLLQ